eukprot:SAG31_NODE_333_length_17527_cov_6.972056_18_plen_33_part_00
MRKLEADWSGVIHISMRARAWPLHAPLRIFFR